MWVYRLTSEVIYGVSELCLIFPIIIISFCRSFETQNLFAVNLFSFTTLQKPLVEKSSGRKEKSVLQAKLTKLAIQIGYAGMPLNIGCNICASVQH